MSINHLRTQLLSPLAAAIVLLTGSSADAQTTPPVTTPPVTNSPVTTASGLTYQSLRDGNGAAPAATDVVKVNYKGTLADGTVFDSSYDRHEPAQFPLYRVIPCWTEGVQMMKVGGKARLTCPPQIAYGESGAGGTIPPNATLTFEVELLAVVPEETAP